VTKDEEIVYFKGIIKKHLSPFRTEGEIDVGPCFPYWYCPICQEIDYWYKDKIKHTNVALSLLQNIKKKNYLIFFFFMFCSKLSATFVCLILSLYQ
jgi:hypothetical protein